MTNTTGAKQAVSDRTLLFTSSKASGISSSALDQSQCPSSLVSWSLVTNNYGFLDKFLNFYRKITMHLQRAPNVSHISVGNPAKWRNNDATNAMLGKLELFHSVLFRDTPEQLFRRGSWGSNGSRGR